MINSDVQIHATCLSVNTAGLLLRGSSGVGKSQLALHFIESAQRGGYPALLVGDDQINLVRHSGVVIANSLPIRQGQIEARGLGILKVPQQSSVIIKLVVDFTDRAMIARMPTVKTTLLLGVAIRTISVPVCALEEAALMVRLALGRGDWLHEITE